MLFQIYIHFPKTSIYFSEANKNLLEVPSETKRPRSSSESAVKSGYLQSDDAIFKAMRSNTNMNVRSYHALPLL